MTHGYQVRYLSEKLAIVRGLHYPYEAWFHAHWCPACDELHTFAVEHPFTSGSRWSYDNNHEFPSFSPSMNISIGPYPEDSSRAGEFDRCHYFLTHGNISYCSDSTHHMSGKTVPLPNLPQKQIDRWKPYEV